MAKEEIIQKVKETMEAPSCFAGLKAVCQEYLEAQGTGKEKEAAEKLSAALKDCVQSIDTVIPFFKSEAGVKYFGKETAAALAKAADEAKERARSTASARRALPADTCSTISMNCNPLKNALKRGCESGDPVHSLFLCPRRKGLTCCYPKGLRRIHFHIFPSLRKPFRLE